MGSNGCSTCSAASETLFKCRDCWDGGHLLCRECMITAHASNPFHVIEVSDAFYIHARLLIGISLGPEPTLKRLPLPPLVIATSLDTAGGLARIPPPLPPISRFSIQMVFIPSIWTTASALKAQPSSPSFCVRPFSLLPSLALKLRSPSTCSTPSTS